MGGGVASLWLLSLFCLYFPTQPPSRSFPQIGQGSLLGSQLFRTGWNQFCPVLRYARPLFLIPIPGVPVREALVKVQLSEPRPDPWYRPRRISFQRLRLYHCPVKGLAWKPSRALSGIFGAWSPMTTGTRKHFI